MLDRKLYPAEAVQSSGVPDVCSYSAVCGFGPAAAGKGRILSVSFFAGLAEEIFLRCLEEVYRCDPSGDFSVSGRAEGRV